MARTEIETLLRLLDEAYERKAWHGPNLRGSLRGITARQAAWRPGPRRHNIWEVTIHAAYWKYAVRRRLHGGKRGSFALQGSNWFARPVAPSEKAWRADVRLLADEHRQLREAVRGLRPGLVHKRFAGARGTPLDHILGIAFHDVYHAGQIQLLKKLYRARRA